MLPSLASPRFVKACPWPKVAVLGREGGSCVVYVCEVFLILLALTEDVDSERDWLTVV